MKPYWQGVFPAVTTQMHRDGTLDLEATARHLEVLIDSGVGGLVMCGSLGENQSLDGDEKRAVVEAAVGVVAGRIPVLSGVAETSTRAASRYVRDCRALGADGFMVMPAMAYRGDEREVLGHLRAVAKATDAPLMIYNNPVCLRERRHAADVREARRDRHDRRAEGELGQHAPDHRPAERGGRSLRAVHRCRRPRARERGARASTAGWRESASRSPTRTSSSGISPGRASGTRRARSTAGTRRSSTSTSARSWCRTSSSRCRRRDSATSGSRAPRLQLVGAERTRVLGIIREGIATRPKLPGKKRGARPARTRRG